MFLSRCYATAPQHHPEALSTVRRRKRGRTCTIMKILPVFCLMQQRPAFLARQCGLNNREMYHRTLQKHSMDSHSCEGGGNQPNLRWPWGPSKDIQGVRMKPPWISLGKAAYLLPPLPRHHHMAFVFSGEKRR